MGNRVFFITQGQRPEWLNVDNPQLCLIDHRDYIPAEGLPTFNSRTIEMNIHRTPGLLEHYVYFNDDMALLRPLEPDFYFRDGLPVLPAKLSIPGHFHQPKDALSRFFQNHIS